ncbi:unnamed protein product [Ilex paraguariensis]|uniref:Uncharacterized protein n=1 Tax=Ilex paraguariensis TaxID=185542 RepID=A0ABC8S0Z3_9AQUA
MVLGRAEIINVYKEASGLADFLASYDVQTECSNDFSGSGVLPMVGKSVLLKDQCLLPKSRMKKVLVWRKGREGVHDSNIVAAYRFF